MAGGAGGVGFVFPGVIPGIWTGSPVGKFIGSPEEFTTTSGKQSIEDVWYIAVFVGAAGVVGITPVYSQ